MERRQNQNCDTHLVKSAEVRLRVGCGFVSELVAFSLMLSISMIHGSFEAGQQ